MGLIEIQSALARLYTNGEARSQLRDNPDHFATAHGLTPPELDSLRQQAATAIEPFARSLLHKRANEAGHAIPLTRSALGLGYADAFQKFAAQGPAASRDPAFDALAFLRWLRTAAAGAVSIETRNAARYESAYLSVLRGGRRFAAGLFELPERPGCVARKVFTLWWRWSNAGNCRSWQWILNEKR
jgi:hypothetical protein